MSAASITADPEACSPVSHAVPNLTDNVQEQSSSQVVHELRATGSGQPKIVYRPRFSPSCLFTRVKRDISRLINAQDGCIKQLMRLWSQWREGRHYWGGGVYYSSSRRHWASQLLACHRKRADGEAGGGCECFFIRSAKPPSEILSSAYSSDMSDMTTADDKSLF